MNLSFTSTMFVLALLIGGLSLPCPGEASHSLPEADMQVDGEGIFLDAIATGCDGPAPHLRLAAAPPLGRPVTLRREQIIERLEREGIELTSINLPDTEQIVVTRRARSFGESDLKELLTSALQREYVQDKGELELRFARAWATVTVPDDSISIKVLDLPMAGVSPNFILRFELITPYETIGSWQLPVQARVWREVLVARSQLKRGQLFADADVARERRDVLMLRDVLAGNVADASLLEIAENVPVGTPLYARSVRLRTLVRRGQLAEATVRDGSLAISMKVEVLEDGSLGQQVRVRNPQSKREFRGKVQDEQTILVAL